MLTKNRRKWYLLRTLPAEGTTCAVSRCHTEKVMASWESGPPSTRFACERALHSRAICSLRSARTCAFWRDVHLPCLSPMRGWSHVQKHPYPFPLSSWPPSDWRVCDNDRFGAWRRRVQADFELCLLLVLRACASLSFPICQRWVNIRTCLAGMVSGSRCIAHHVKRDWCSTKLFTDDNHLMISIVITTMIIWCSQLLPAQLFSDSDSSECQGVILYTESPYHDFL